MAADFQGNPWPGENGEKMMRAARLNGNDSSFPVDPTGRGGSAPSRGDAPAPVPFARSRPTSGRPFLSFVLLLAAVLFSAGEALGQTLFVFWPTTIRPNVLEKRLQEFLPGARVVVFGRYYDFIAKVAEERPDAILTNPALAGQFNGYSSGVHGLLNGSTESAWVVLSPNRALDLSRASALGIGAIDILGRKDMNRFAEALLEFRPSLKLVSKVEDLLPLLLLQMADGILVQENLVAYFRSVSKLDLRVNRFQYAHTGLAVVVVNSRSKAAAEILQSFRKMPRNLCLWFGVEQWK